MNNSLLAEIDLTFLPVFICGLERGVFWYACGRRYHRAGYGVTLRTVRLNEQFTGNQEHNFN